jgi:hypothetical protein
MFNVIIFANIVAIAIIISQLVFVNSESNSEQFIQTIKFRQKHENSANIDFFDLNFDEKLAFTKKVVVYVEKITYCQNFHVFVKKVKEIISVLNFETIRKNLSSWFRKIVFVWHIFKLFDVFRKILSYDKNVNEWI